MDINDGFLDQQMHYVLLENFTLLHKSDLYKHVLHAHKLVRFLCVINLIKFLTSGLSIYKYIFIFSLHFLYPLSIHECSPEIK